MNAVMSLADRLEALRADGAATYDGPGFRFIEALLSRAEALDGEAAARLRARAALRISALRDRLETDQERAARLLETLQAAGADPEGVYAAAFAVGDHRRLVRESEAALRRARSDGEAADRARLERLAAQAAEAGLRVPESVAGAIEAGDARGAGDRLAQALFRHVVDDARGVVTVARATDRLPDTVGPYNPEALAARVLAAAEALSPGYLRAVLGGLEDLGGLAALPAVKVRRRR